MNEKLPYQNPNENNGFSSKPPLDNEKRFGRVRTLTTIANVAAPVSLFVGGMLLSMIGLVCAIVARITLSSMRRDAASPTIATSRIPALLRANVVSIVICCIALALNIASAAILLWQIASGSISFSFVGIGSGSGASTSSLWG